MGIGSAPAAGAVRDNSANGIVVWTACHQVYQLTDAELDQWHDRGVRGFACNLQRLPGMGSTAKFTGDLNALAGPDYVLERTLLGSKIVERAHRHGMKMYLGFYFANGENGSTPLGEWFDDTAWSDTVVPAVASVAAAARALGFDGLAFDQELYPQNNGKQTATWAWNYPGNTHPEAATREEVRVRGGQLMKAILGAYPGVDILAYNTKFPGTWDALVQQEINGARAPFDDLVQIDFWNGLTGVNGYDTITLLNATFYKTPHVGSWDTAYTYEYNNLFALLSRRLTNWTYAASRLRETPFVWINAGTSGFESARSPSYVAEQLDAARRWGMGRMFADYAYGELQAFDYGPYEDAMRTASKPGVVDDHRPTLAVESTPATTTSEDISLSGTAHDDHAIHFVRWKTGTGATGTAEMTWNPGSGDPALGWKDWSTSWVAKDVPLVPGTNRVMITVVDTKGLQTVKTVKVVR
jgi:hypothetical protein